MRLRALAPALVALAACNNRPASEPSRPAAPGSAAPATAPPATAGSAPAPATDLDVGVAFAPKDDHDAAEKALAALEVPLEKARPMLRAEDLEALARDEPRQRATAYDLDRDGGVDLVVLPMTQRRIGREYPGWFVGSVEGGKLGEPLMAMGFWADVRVGRGAVTLRFQEVSPVGGNPVYSTTLHFANRAWAKPIRSQVAMQGKIPAVQPPYGRFTTRERAKLRAAPAIDDTSEVPDGFDHTATMGGNVLAVYGAGARGLLLAREGAFRYVAFDAPIRPLETSPMDDGTNIDPSQYHARCGWISEGELVE